MSDQPEVTAEVPLCLLACSECGISFAMPKVRYLRGFLDDGVAIWCPNGHKSERSGEVVEA